MLQIDLKNINIPKNDAKKEKLLTISDFFEMGELKAGDRVYLKTAPEESIATLLDFKYVYYKGQKMTINEWGCRVTGWTAIRIYEYMAKVGEQETLQDKRDRFSKDVSEDKIIEE